MCQPPAATATWPDDATGAGTDVCPSACLPQHATRPFDDRAQVWYAPAARDTCTVEAASGDTVDCPQSFLPQHDAKPAADRAHVWYQPAASTRSLARRGSEQPTPEDAGVGDEAVELGLGEPEPLDELVPVALGELVPVASLVRVMEAVASLVRVMVPVAVAVSLGHANSPSAGSMAVAEALAEALAETEALPGLK